LLVTKVQEIGISHDEKQLRTNTCKCLISDHVT